VVTGLVEGLRAKHVGFSLKISAIKAKIVWDSLLITNNKDSLIHYDNITLATYLLWEDQASSLKECMGLPADTDLTGRTSASAYCTFGGSVLSLLLLFDIVLFF
jgi:hypothetical protein